MNKNLDGWAIAPEVYNWIRRNIKDGSTILELGSGTGTLELCKHYTVYSIEHDKQWVGKTDSNYIYAPIVHHFEDYVNYEWYDVSVLKEQLPKSYDLLLIDGPPGRIGRIPLLYNLNLFNLKIPIIVDDTHRSDETELFKQLNKKLNRDIITIKSNDKESKILL